MAKWEDLSMHERHAFIRTAVKNGIKDIGSIRDRYNEFAEGGEKKTEKVGPTYNPETKTWSNPHGKDITGQSFKGQYGITTYLPTGAVDLDTSSGLYKQLDDYHKWRYADNAPRTYIGGSTNEARQKYFDKDTEFTNTVKAMAKQYGISPNVLASRIAKEGPIDEAIRHYNNTNGLLKRGHMIGPIWGLDDMGTMVWDGTLKVRPELRERLETDYEMENEKGRTTFSVGSENYLDGIEATAITMKHFKDEMKKRFPKASDAQLERYATAAFNRGITGATDFIKSGKMTDEYLPFINIKANGGGLDLLAKPFSYTKIPSVRYEDGGYKSSHPHISRAMHQSGGNNNPFLGALGYISNNDVHYYDGTFPLSGYFARTLHGETPQGRDLVNLYLDGDTTGFEEYPDATPIIRNGIELTGKQYKGNLFPLDTLNLSPKSLDTINKLIDSKRLLSYNTDNMTVHEWDNSLNDMFETMPMLDDAKKVNVSFKRDEKGNPYMDIFDRWDLAGTTGIAGDMIEEVIENDSLDNGPFILRQRVPITFDKNKQSNGLLLNHLSNGQWQRFLNNKFE